MLVRFTIDPGCIESATADAQTIAAHRRLIQLWKDFGICIYSGPSLKRSNLRNGIDACTTQSVRKHWQEALKKKLRTAAGPPGWPGIESAFAKSDLLGSAEVLEMACVTDDRALSLGVEPDSGMYFDEDTDIEVSILGSIDQTEAFRRAARLQSVTFQSGHLVEEIWKAYFPNLVRHGTNCVIVDRYALHRPNALKGIIERLSSAPDLKLTVYAAISAELPKSTAVQRFNDSFNQCPEFQMNSTLVLNNSSDMQKAVHSRYIRVDETIVWIDDGVRSFESETLQKALHVSCHQHNGGTRSIEYQMRETRVREV